jgi:hypothetical protein
MHDKDDPIRGEVRAVGFRRVSHGLFLEDRPGLQMEDEFRRELRAWLLVLPVGAVFTHVTGARLRGWRLPALPEQVPVFAAVHGSERHPRRPGLICSRLVDNGDVEPPEAHACAGLPADAPEEILLRCARDLGHVDLVLMIDSALAIGELDVKRLEQLLASRRPGVRALRCAYEASDHRAESAGETVLRLFHLALDVAVELQVELWSADGTFVGRADLLVRGTDQVHEYDGAIHRGESRHRADLRERRLAGSSYIRRGFTMDDLVNHPAVAMHEIDAALARPHEPARLRRWRRMIEGSLYSERGRARVLNRWRRQMGVVDWR